LNLQKGEPPPLEAHPAMSSTTRTGGCSASSSRMPSTRSVRVPSGIVSPALQFGTELSSFGGSAGAPSAVCNLKRNAIQLLLRVGGAGRQGRDYPSRGGTADGDREGTSIIGRVADALPRSNYEVGAEYGHDSGAYVVPAVEDRALTPSWPYRADGCASSAGPRPRRLVPRPPTEHLGRRPCPRRSRS
jgi:hypothetical protein